MKAASDETRLTDPAFFLVTLAYAAPEQVRGDTVTAATDIYALGVIAYEMLTGARPFDAGNRVTPINQMLTVRPVSPAVHRAGLSETIDRAVMRALDKNPDDRWARVTDFVDALQEAAGDAGSDAASDGGGGLLARYELGGLVGRGRLGSLIYRGTHRALGVPVAIRVLKRDEQPHWDAVSALHRSGGFICGVNPDMIRIRSGGARGADSVGGGNPSGLPEQIVLSSAGIRSVQDVLATMREQELRGQEASEQELPYVAPEVLMGGAPNARADIFTLGVIAYEMVSGRQPFRAASVPELLGQMLQVRPASPGAAGGRLPQAASDAIIRAIDAVPAARFDSADTFRDALLAPV